jgi:hypothetical protein
MYLSKIAPWKSNKWIAPPPHEIARIRKEAGTHEGDEDFAGKNSEDIEKPSTTAEPNVNGAAASNGTTATNGAALKEAQI